MVNGRPNDRGLGLGKSLYVLPPYESCVTRHSIFRFAPAMPERSSHQKKLIERYYDQRDNIMLTKLQEIVTDLFLADSDPKRDRLWKRAEKALQNLKIPAERIAQVTKGHKAETLARYVRDWKEAPKK